MTSTPSATARFFAYAGALAAVILFVASIFYASIFVFYPTELEWREGTNWLHPLALRNGINIFDFHQRIYINASHGIFDHIIKAALLYIFPILPPSVILRAFVLLQPIAAAVAFYAALAGRPLLMRLTQALLLSTATLALLHFVGFWYTCLGRSDATALFLLTCTFLCCTPGFERTCPRSAIFAAPILVALTFYTNWRIGPCAALLPLLYTSRLDAPALRRLLRFAVLTAAAIVTLGTLFACIWFNRSAIAFIRYFFGFFLGDSGWAIHASVSVKELANNIQDPAVYALLIVCPIPLLLALVDLCRRRDKSSFEALPGLGVLLAMLISLLALKSNFRGGGFWYLAPAILILGFYVCTRVSTTRSYIPVVALACVGAFVIFSPRYPMVKYIVTTIFRTTPNARVYIKQLSRLDARFGITSDELHLYRTGPSLPKVDMGDTAEAVSAAGLFGSTFTQTFQAYSAEIERHPPALILTNGLSSSAVSKLIKGGGYRKLLTSPAPSGVGELYARKDCFEAAQLLLSNPP